MLFKVRDEVEPIFTIEELGEVYVIDDILHTTHSIMFLGYIPRFDKMYTFNCSDIGNSYIEYVMQETTFDMIDRSNNKTLNAVDFMKEADNMGGLYILICGVCLNLFEQTNFEELGSSVTTNYIPSKDSYFSFDRKKINGKKYKKY